MVTVTPSARSLPHASTWQHMRDLRMLLNQPISLVRSLANRGDITTFLNNRNFFLNTPQLAYAVIVQHAAEVDRSQIDRANLLPLIGESVLAAVQPAHRRQRKILAPVFNHTRVRAYGDTMVATAERLQQSWQEGQQIEIHEAMVHITLEIVAQALFGTSIDAHFDQLFHAINELAMLVTLKSNLGVHFPRSWPTPNNLRFRRALAQVDAILYQIIAERRQSGEDRGDFLSMLLQTRDAETGEGMDDQQVRDEAMTIFLAGHETTANALSWSWYLLTRHPEAYARVYAETSDVLGGRSPTVADLPQLPYTQQVFKEALRLYPPAWLMDREVLHPFELDGFSIAKGSILALSSYTLHRRSDYFPDPEKFDPERFAPGKEEQLPRMAYMPFGDGPRVCLGNRFAQLEGQLLLAAIAQRVRFEPVDLAPVPVSPALTLRPGAPILVRVHRH